MPWMATRSPIRSKAWPMSTRQSMPTQSAPEFARSSRTWPAPFMYRMMGLPMSWMPAMIFLVAGRAKVR
ncbi:hypothetical protein D3C87_2037310 [compost metagenome]